MRGIVQLNLYKEKIMKFATVFFFRTLSILFLVGSIYFCFWGKCKLALAMLGFCVVCIRGLEWLIERMRANGLENEEGCDY